MSPVESALRFQLPGDCDAVAADHGAGFLKIMDWVIDRLREASAAAA